MTDIMTWLVGVQSAIHATIADHILAFSAAGDWLTLLAVVPLGLVFGAAHGLTPGHNKVVLASYVAGDGVPAIRASLMALVLTAVHVGSAVIVALFAGFLVSRTMTSAGQAPMLETVSRVLLLAAGIWLVVRALGNRAHVHGEGFGFAVAAGLVPCPLTLFVMVFALANGVPQAGLMFALAMVGGVGAVLIAVALVASVGSRLFKRFLTRHGATAGIVARSIELVAGGILVLLALMQLAR